jgi:anti-sigma factor RsiW
MRCSDCVVWISRNLDGLLSEAEAEALKAHLAKCARCRAELALQKMLVRSLKQEMPAGLPAGFALRVTERALALTRAERRHRAWLAYVLPAIPLGAVAAFLFIFGREIPGLTAPAMASVAQVIGRPFAGFGDSTAQAIARGLAISEESADHLAPLRWILASPHLGMSLALGAVAWAFSRAYAFVRH